MININKRLLIILTTEELKNLYDIEEDILLSGYYDGYEFKWFISFSKEEALSLITNPVLINGNNILDYDIADIYEINNMIKSLSKEIINLKIEGYKNKINNTEVNNIEEIDF